jgi:hypothetical protein
LDSKACGFVPVVATPPLAVSPFGTSSVRLRVEIHVQYRKKAPKRTAMSLDSFFAACKYLSCVMCVVCMQWGSQFTEPGVGLRFVLFYSIFHRWGFWPASSISGVSLFNLRLPHYFSSIRVISTDNDIHCYSDPASL